MSPISCSEFGSNWNFPYLDAAITTAAMEELAAAPPLKSLFNGGFLLHRLPLDHC